MAAYPKQSWQASKTLEKQLKENTRNGRVIFCEQIQEAELIWAMFLKRRAVQPACAQTLSIALCLGSQAGTIFFFKIHKIQM